MLARAEATCGDAAAKRSRDIADLNGQRF